MFSYSTSFQHLCLKSQRDPKNPPKPMKQSSHDKLYKKQRLSAFSWDFNKGMNTKDILVLNKLD